MFVKNDVLYVVIGVLYVAEFKFTGPIPETSSFTHFWESGPRPWGLFWLKNAPKMPILLKKTFLTHNFD